MKNLRTILIVSSLLLTAGLVLLGFKYKTPSNEIKHILLERHMEKKLEAAPVIAMARDAMEICLKFLVNQASPKEIEGQKQLLLKQRSTVPISCREAFNTFLFFIDEIANENISAINKDQMDDLQKALHSAFTDLVTTYVSYLDDQYGYPNLEKPGKIDLD
ncbi:MAG: hypothetical protein LBH49_03420 [Puniceicoccales bacterium]|jgi:hypothetical protein|nr:hypothetical protein [Puniceicoccales bacterium]